MNYTNLTSMQLDALKEVGNIGSGNAATALSQLLNSKVEMTVPNVNIVSFDQIFDRIGGEEVVVGVLVRVLGDCPGNILFVFPKQSGELMIKNLTKGVVEDISGMGSSVLCEIGNIVSTTYMNAVARFANLLIIPSVPAMAYDMLGAILSTTFIESGQFDDHVLDIETSFIQDGSEMRGYFYYIPMPGSLEKILNSLGVN